MPVPNTQPRYTQSHALVIGIDDYDALPALGRAVHSAELVAQALAEQFGFQVTLLRNAEATRSAILAYLDEMLTGTAPDDRLLIYFAGHGLTRHATTGERVGLLAPYGVGRGQGYEAIEIGELAQKIEAIPAKHTLIMLDACLNGLSLIPSVTGEAVSGRSLLRRALQIIAAGQAGEESEGGSGPGVLSAFTELFLERLAQGGDHLTASQLGAHLQEQIAARTGTRQTVQYGHLRGSQGGDFVLWGEATLRLLPMGLQTAMDSPLAGVREGAVRELEALLSKDDPTLAEVAREALGRMARDPSPEVSVAAKKILNRYPPPDASEAGTGVSFFWRWWRVGILLIAGMLAFFGTLAYADYEHGISAMFLFPVGLLVIFVGASHLPRRRWLRSIYFLLTSLTWLAAGVWNYLKASIDVLDMGLDELVYACLVSGGLGLLWALIDAIRGKGV